MVYIKEYLQFHYPSTAFPLDIKKCEHSDKKAPAEASFPGVSTGLLMLVANTIIRTLSPVPLFATQLTVFPFNSRVFSFNSRDFPLNSRVLAGILSSLFTIMAIAQGILSLTTSYVTEDFLNPFGQPGMRLKKPACEPVSGLSCVRLT